MKKNPLFSLAILILASIPSSTSAKSCGFAQESSVEEVADCLIKKMQHKLTKQSYVVNEDISNNAISGLLTRISRALSIQAQHADFEALQKFLVESLAHNPNAWNSLYKNKKINKMIRKVIKEYQKTHKDFAYSKIKSILSQNIDASDEDLDKMVLFFASYILETEKASEIEKEKINEEFEQIFYSYFNKSKNDILKILPQIQNLLTDHSLTTQLRQDAEMIPHFREYIFAQLLQNENPDPSFQDAIKEHIRIWSQKSMDIAEEAFLLGDNLNSLMQDEDFIEDVAKDLDYDIQKIIPEQSATVKNKIREIIIKTADVLSTADGQKNSLALNKKLFVQNISHMLRKMIEMSALKKEEQRHLLSIKPKLLRLIIKNTQNNDFFEDSSPKNILKKLLEKNGHWWTRKPSQSFLETTSSILEKLMQIMMHFPQAQERLDDLEGSSIYLAFKVFPYFVQWSNFSEKEKEKIEKNQKEIFNLLLSKNDDIPVKEFFEAKLNKMFEEKRLFGIMRKDPSAEFLSSLINILTDLEDIIKKPHNSPWLPLLLEMPKENIWEEEHQSAVRQEKNHDLKQQAPQQNDLNENDDAEWGNAFSLESDSDLKFKEQEKKSPVRAPQIPPQFYLEDKSDFEKESDSENNDFFQSSDDEE